MGGVFGMFRFSRMSFGVPLLGFAPMMTSCSSTV
jgi:hypothetical protein